MCQYVILGHENPDVDSIFSGVLLETILRRMGKNAKFIIPDSIVEADTKNIIEKYGIILESFQRDFSFSPSYDYILVDHHNRRLPKVPTQIIDHHLDYNFTTSCPDYQNQEACSTTCIIGKRYEEYLTRRDVILILVAALVDTASFHSSKTVFEDISWLRKKCMDFSITMDDYYDEGLCLTDISNLQKAAFNGLKKYTTLGKKFESSYIQVKDVSKKSIQIQEMVGILQEYLKKKKLYEFTFILHDMDIFQSKVYHLYPNRIDISSYNHYVSRGKQIIPEIQNRIEEEITIKQKKRVI